VAFALNDGPGQSVMASSPDRSDRERLGGVVAVRSRCPRPWSMARHRPAVDCEFDTILTGVSSRILTGSYPVLVRLTARDELEKRRPRL